jgi:hypothetical protein
MPEFRAYTLDGEGRITAAAKLLTCVDDTHALERAARLSREAEAPVEVWEGTRRVGCVTPDSLSPEPPAP